MKYLKVFTDFAEILEPLQDAEVGRLFKSMLAYAETGAVPDLRGNERFVWNAAKQIIDREHEYSDKQAEKGKKGGRPKKPEKADESRKSQKDKDKEKYKEINSKEFTKKAATATFAPPTVEEVASYCKTRNNTVNAQAFVDYYTGRGWYLSKGVKVKDWRACVRTWEQREPKKKDRYGAENYQQHAITEDMLRDAFVNFEEDT